MSLAKSPPRATGREQGSALVIVLFFLILLTALTVLFLSRSMSALKVSSGSTSESKADLMAFSAGNIIIGDLKQEIVAGSATSGTSSWPVYTPTSNLTMIPFQSGVPTGTGTSTAIANMISRSVRPGNTGGSCPYVPYTAIYSSTSAPPNRAADDTAVPANVSTITPSLNGRYITLSDWNGHYLIPRNTSVDTLGSTSADSTPLSSFVAPDWVIVTRSGAHSVTWNSNLSSSTSTNSGYAVGRYAYAIYNEGGLLDMNAAGYPGTDAGSGSTGLTSTQTSEKVGLPLADLTQLTAGGTLTQAQVNNIVGWRNYASAELTTASGTYGAFKFTSTGASNWLTNFASGNTNGFLQVTPPPSGVTTPPTDQAFLTRQQLIHLTQSLSISPDFLQYLGTFSRALEQPSTVPNPSRPKILTTGGAPPATSSADNYTGNNDGEGGDTDPTGINPSFLAIRVQSAFTRWNGTTAVVGEPLVKTKFALSHLSLVAYNATNATATAAYGTTSDPDPILDRFGLTRTSTSSPWTYNPTGSASGVSILTLSQVAALSPPREPNFAELLKASIIAGSLAKAAPNLPLGSENYQYLLDSTLDLQVLQIMANLIDQQDTDSYPTVIQIYNGSYYLSAYGIEDLPYFYRYHLLSVVDTLPSPLLSNATSVTFPAIGTGVTTTGSTIMAVNYTTGNTVSDSWSVANTTAVNSGGTQLGTLSNRGECTLMYVPDVWNPHDMNALVSSSNSPNAGTSNRPVQFRIYAVTQDPVGLTPQWNLGAESQMGSNQILRENDGTPMIYDWPISKPVAYASPTGSNTMTFSDAGGTLFREPTLLWHNTSPTGIALSGPSITDANNTSQTYYGIVAGKTPISTQATITSTPSQPTDGTYVFQGIAVTTLQYIPVGAFPQITFYLQYQDPNNSSNWITYDVKYPDLHGLQPPNLVANITDYSNYQNVLQTGQFSSRASGIDPRSARWGVGTASSLGEVSPSTSGNGTSNVTYLLEPLANSYFNDVSTDGKLLNTNFTVLETDRPRGDKGNQTNYSNPGMSSDTGGGRNLQMRIFSGAGWSASSGINSAPVEFAGLLSQNNPALTFNSRDNSTTGQHIYMEDADGVARRAMGAYAGTTLTDLQYLSTASVANNTTRNGLPMATANQFPNNNGVASPVQQSQSRPIILNRPFRSVAEMSYSFRGTPWKNIDFFTPESGDAALLDTFCLTEPPANAVVAGKVDLNTRQTAVLQAIIAGAYRDEVTNTEATQPTYAEPALSSGEAANIASTLEAITSDTTHSWRGPLQNISGLVGRYVSTPSGTSDTDFYTYVPPTPVSGQTTSASYAGLSSALNCTSFNGNAKNVFTLATPATAKPNVVTPTIQRLRESAIRPLASAGQVRVWNLLIDVIAQTGRYPKTATALNQFDVEGQTHLWIHVAIDRYTGQVIDKQVEVVTQ